MSTENIPEQKLEKLSVLAKSSARNKLIIHKESISSLKTVNLGLEISKKLHTLEGKNYSSQLVFQITDDILDANETTHPALGKYLAIHNLGILFEPSIKINIANLLDRKSQNNLLFIFWPGDIEKNNLYFMTKKNGIKTDISSISHIKL